jgi:chromatin assembly factor 1 subunit B
LQDNAAASPVYVAHIILRRSPKESFAFLPCGKEPAIAARFCPSAFRLHADRPGGASSAAAAPHFNLPYRLVFAIATQDSILVYDTQDMKTPLLSVTGVHFTSLTDLSWSSDGTYLMATSSDGYCTIVEFNASELTEPIGPDDLKALTKNVSAAPALRPTPPADARAVRVARRGASE